MFNCIAESNGINCSALPSPKNLRRERSGCGCGFSFCAISACIWSSVFFTPPPLLKGCGSGMKRPPSCMSGMEKSIAPPLANFFFFGAALMYCWADIGASSKSRRRVAVALLYGSRDCFSISLISNSRMRGSGYCISKSICARRLDSAGSMVGGAGIVAGPRRRASSSS